MIKLANNNNEKRLKGGLMMLVNQTTIHNKEVFNTLTESLSFCDVHYWRTLQHIKREYLEEYCKNKVVIDLGCGTGEFTFIAAEYAKKVAGIDFAGKMLEKMKKRMQQFEKPNIYLLQADITKLPLKENNFDVIYSYSTLYYIKEIEVLFYEMNRVLKKGGFAIFELGNKFSHNTLLVKKSNLISHHISTSKMLMIIKSTGFKVVEHRAFQICMWNVIPFMGGTLEKKVSKKINEKMIDEIISSLPILRNFAFRHLFVCKKEE